MTAPRPTGAPSAALAPPGLDLVLFRWGPLHLALPARQVSGLGPDSDPEAPAVGDLLQLPAATSDAGLPPPPSAAIRRLSLRGAGPGAGLRVQEPVSQVRLDAVAIHPLPPLVAARLRLPLVRALACPGDPAGTIILILDPAAARTGLSPPRQDAPTQPPSHD